MPTETCGHLTHVCAIRNGQEGGAAQAEDTKYHRLWGEGNKACSRRWKTATGASVGGVPEAGAQQAAGAWGARKMLGWFLLRTMEAAKRFCLISAQD